MNKRRILVKLYNQARLKYKGDIGSEGKFGDVVILEETSSERKTAGKIVSADRMKENEIQVWSLLQHTNIVELEKCISVPDLNARCFVMPRQFMNLEEMVKADWFQKDEDRWFDIKRWLLDTLSGIEYLHRNSLCHLNIQASNVLVSYDSTAKLGGLSLLSSSAQPVGR